MRRVARLALAALLGACAPPAVPTAEATDPCVLHPPAELTPDLVVEQHVVARYGGREGAFDAVLQKRGDELLVVGLGPMNVRAFVVRQVGTDVTLEQRLGPAPPFSPRNVIVDVHRVFFKRLPGAVDDGGVRGHLDGEDVVETWRGGELVERRFEREGRRAVRVFFGAGCRRERCAPVSARVVNEQLGYEVALENRQFTWL